MPALGFKDQHVNAVLVGAKPFTLRKSRKDGKDPRAGDSLHLFKGWRTPAMLKFATARCAMRVTLEFDHRGLAKVHHRGLEMTSPPVFVSVGQALLDAAELDAATAQDALTRLAEWDGFATWDDLYAFHVGNEPGARTKHDGGGHLVGPVIRRELIGLMAVTPEAAYLNTTGVQPDLTGAAS